MSLSKLLSKSTPTVMGILNVTPDSFSDGGRFNSLESAKQQIEHMLEAGAHILDIGGESTRPGAQKVSLQEEMDRVLPLLELAKTQFGALVSVDTYKPRLMQEALSLGVDMVNDVKALQETGAVDVVAASEAHVCLMHMQGTPETMQNQPSYEDIVQDMQQFFEERVQVCENAGISPGRILLDPGFGFGKTVAHNYTLLSHLDKFAALSHPLLVGISRKSMLGAITGKEIDDRLISSVSAAVIAAMKGAKIIRVHDVAETVEALQIVNATEFGEQ